MTAIKQQVQLHLANQLQQKLQLLALADEEPLMVLVKQAEEVLGSRAAAYEWIFEPVYSLNQKQPITCITSDEGFEETLQVLTNIECGIPP